VPVHPQTADLLTALEAQGTPDFADLSVSQARDLAAAFKDLQAPAPEMASVVDRTVPGPAGRLPIRVYTPQGSPRGLLVYFHGGGWVIGNIEIVDSPCRALADAAGCVVVSAQYRLAPESAYPAAPEDCYAVTRWVADNRAELGTGAGGIAVGGDSAGGNLAAAVALMARDRGGPDIAFQALIYPATDLSSFETGSYQRNAQGYLLTARSMQWFRDHYVPDDAQRKEPYASPALAPDHSGLPPAFIAISEFDPLHDDGDQYASALEEAGVPVELHRYAGQIHGIFWLSGACSQAFDPLLSDLAATLKKTLA
jgi:acetyl esterase